MNIRIKFEKYGTMKYLGHLDLMRYFQKALRRAHFPLEFSKGFHPHPIMSFAQPLSVGVTSAGEYFDVALCEDIECEAFRHLLNEKMEDGVFVSEITVLPEKSKNAMSLVCAARYIVFFKTLPLGFDMGVAESAISALMSKPEIIYTKKTKKGESTKDIKPFIYDFCAVNIDSDNKFEIEKGAAFSLHIKSGSEDNLTPVPIVMMALNEISFPCDSLDFGVHRCEIILSK